MQILFLSRWFPAPPDNGSKLRVYSLLRGLAEEHEVTLLSFIDHPDEGRDSQQLEPWCREVKTILRKPFEPYSRRAITGLLSPVPRSVVDTFSPEMAHAIREEVANRKFDLVIASQEGTAVYARCFEGIPALFEEVEIAVLYERQSRAENILSRSRHYLTWLKQKHHLARMLGSFRACTVVSDQEQALLSSQIPGLPHVEVIPNCVSLSDYRVPAEPPRRKRLIFTGSFRYEPNHEAMCWFVREVYPQVRQRVPDVELLITGDPAGLTLPPEPGVTLAGHVPDVRPLVAESSVSLAPIHVGGGTRLKILEAMALGTPVIATPKGAEGLRVVSGRDLLIADTPEQFIEATVRVLTDASLRRRLANSAFRLVGSRYDWPVVMPQFLRLLDRVARRPEG
ncbi:MAG: glycosyltransferase [Acidobacteriota bacterium]